MRHLQEKERAAHGGFHQEELLPEEEEQREIMEADMLYLKAYFQKLAQEKQESVSGDSGSSGGVPGAGRDGNARSSGRSADNARGKRD